MDLKIYKKLLSRWHYGSHPTLFSTLFSTRTTGHHLSSSLSLSFTTPLGSGPCYLSPYPSARTSPTDQPLMVIMGGMRCGGGGTDMGTNVCFGGRGRDELSSAWGGCGFDVRGARWYGHSLWAQVSDRRVGRCRFFFPKGLSLLVVALAAVAPVLQKKKAVAPCYHC